MGLLKLFVPEYRCRCVHKNFIFIILGKIKMSLLTGVALALCALYLLIWSIKKYLRYLAKKKIIKDEDHFMSEIKSLYRQRDFSGLEIKYNLRDIHEKGKIIEWISEQKNAWEWCDEWLRQDQDNGLANTLYGEVMVDVAWNIRGGGVASTVSEGQAVGFVEALMEAKEKLLWATIINPSCPFACARLINVAIGLGDSDLAWDTYSKGAEQTSESHNVFHAMAVYLTPKWHGSSEELFNFCREVSSKDKTGVLLGLIPYAHFEQRMYLAMNGDEGNYSKYFKDENIRREIIDAFQMLNECDLSESHLFSLNVFAKIFIEMGDYRHAKKVFEIIGNRPTRSPWMYDGDDYVDSFLKSKQNVNLLFA